MQMEYKDDVSGLYESIETVMKLIRMVTTKFNYYYYLIMVITLC